MVKLKDDLTDKKNSAEERMSRIREAIHHYSFRPNPQNDFERLVSDTQAVKHNRDAKKFKPLFTNNVSFCLNGGKKLIRVTILRVS